MRRIFGLMLMFLVGAVLMTASEANAGYLIIRIILEGGGEGEKESGGPGMGRPGFPGGPGGLLPGEKMGAGKFKGGPGMPGMPGGESSPKPAHIDPSQCVVAVIPFEEDYTKARTFYPYQPEKSDSNPARKDQIRLNYRNEKLVANLFTDATTIQWYEDLAKSPALTKTKASEVHDLHRKWAATKTDSKQLMNLVDAALGFGMADDAASYSDELLAAYTQAADKSAIPADVQAFAKAYAKIQAGLVSPPPKPAKTEYWQRKFGNARVFNGAHYAVIYGDATNEGDVLRRVSYLEENFKAFFLWYALRGVDLPIPQAPLLAVLTNSGTNTQPGGIDVHILAKALDGPPRLSADGFYSPEHDLLVLSPDRIDEVGVNFARYTQPVYRDGISREKLITGYGPKVSVMYRPNEKKPDDVARMQTIALVERFVEDAAIAAAISREGSRQLLYATQQLPKFVDLPQWLTDGSGNFFARGKEPAFVQSSQGKPVMHVAVATGYGVPNYALQRYFKEYYQDILDRTRDEAKKREDPRYDSDAIRVALLKNVLTDAYFRALVDPKEIRDPDPVREGPMGVAFGVSGAGDGGPGGPGMRPGGPPGMLRPQGGGSGPGRPGGPGMGMPGMGMGPSNPPAGGKHEDDPEVRFRKNRERVAIKAQATSWALYYYLAKARPAELRAFEAELAMLPRDVPLEGASVAAFYRVFNLNPANEETLKQFARNWLDYMHTVSPAGVDIVIHEPKKEEKKDGMPGMPGPGGFPGFPGKN